MSDSETRVYNLRELREIFRARMLEEDFCIGEEKVEKLFRELLNEPELNDEQIPNSQVASNAKEIIAVAMEQFVKEGLRMFESDSSLYKHLKK